MKNYASIKSFGCTAVKHRNKAHAEKSFAKAHAAKKRSQTTARPQNSTISSVFKGLIAACLVIIAVSLAVKPERYLPVCIDGLKLWAFKVLPALLPFLFVTLLLTSLCDLSKPAKSLSPVTSFLYGVGGFGALARIVGLMSGYPAGAKLVSALYENNLISKDEATKISVLSSTSGPTFVIGTVGAGLYCDKKTGTIIFIAHALSAAITAMFFRKYGDNRPIDRHLNNKSDLNLYSAALDAATSMLAVGTLIAVFYVIYNVLADLKIIYPLTCFFNLFIKDFDKAQGLTAGLFECTQGCLYLSKCSNSAALCCAVISFGGLSVLAQSAAFLQKANVKMKIFFSGKIIQAVISYFLCRLLCVVFL